MTKKIFTIAFAFAALFYGGCTMFDDDAPAPKPVIVDTKPLEDSYTRLDAITKKLEEVTKKTEVEKNKSLSKAAAGVKGVLIANDKNPEGYPKNTVNKEASIADDGLSIAGVVASPEDIIEMTNRVNLRLQGKIEQSDELYNKALKELTDTKMVLAKMQAERDIAYRDREDAMRSSQAEIIKIKTASETNERAMRVEFEQKEKEKDNIIKRLGQENAANDYARNSKICALISLICFVIFIFKKSTDWAITGGLAAMIGVAYTSLSIFVATEFFYIVSYIAWGTVAVSVIVFAVYFIYTHRKQVMARAAQEAEEILNGRKIEALDEIQVALDKAKDKYPDAAKQILDVLTDVMGKDAKALIHEMRAWKKSSKQD